MEDDIIPLQTYEANNKEDETRDQPHLNMKTIGNGRDEYWHTMYVNYLVTKQFTDEKLNTELKCDMWIFCIIYNLEGIPQLYQKAKKF